MFDDVLKHRSGRVIALCRVVLAALFLFAIWIDPSQPATNAATTYAVLAAYVAVSAAIAILTWNNWWREARLAAPAHLTDMLVFSLLVSTSEGYTSPFFIFFVFLVLSAAIRWGWRETALTAAAVITLYFAAGLLVVSSNEVAFDLQRFIVRSGHLVILSAILIWFGVNHGFSGLDFSRSDFLPDPSPDDSAVESAAEGAMRITGASRALLVWRPVNAHEPIALALSGGEASRQPVARSALPPRLSSAFLFDLRHNRAIGRGQHRRIHRFSADSALPAGLTREAGIVEGLAVPIRTDAGAGLLILGGIGSLCTDHVEFGDHLGTMLAAHVQRHALLSAVDESAAARSRLSLARDLHDSIVQFLAGATFRIEAIKRCLHEPGRGEEELNELKQLLLQEQQELRSSIGALRKEQMQLSELADDLRTLCQRLSVQWDVKIAFFADLPDRPASMRLHLDTHQLIREAVANAVRHAGARLIDVEVGVEDSDLRLDISNDGTGSEALQEGSPWSIRERVDEANGTLMLASRASGSHLSITLPLGGEART